MRLFSNRVYTPTIVFTAIMGLAMFGGIIFLPVYLQVVQGLSPTESGLALLPMVVGIFTTSISSGQLMSRTGRYRIYPILGADVTAIALILMSTLDADTPYWQIATYFFVFGAGLGFTMQIVVTAVQNRLSGGTWALRPPASHSSGRWVPHSVPRSSGPCWPAGWAITSLLRASGLPAGADEAEIANNVKAIQALPAEIKTVVIDAWVTSLHDVFITAVPSWSSRLWQPSSSRRCPLRGASDVEPDGPVLATE